MRVIKVRTNGIRDSINENIFIYYLVAQISIAFGVRNVFATFSQKYYI